MDELRPGVWTWTAQHPDWDAERDKTWGPHVRSYAIDVGGTVVLFDPIDPPADVLDRAAEVVLTAEWHGRSAAELGLPVRGYHDELPDAIVPAPGFYPEERSLWLPAYAALVTGDALPGGGAAPDLWLGETPRAEYNAKLEPLLQLPIELILPTHGDPVLEDARAHLERALSGWAA